MRDQKEMQRRKKMKLDTSNRSKKKKIEKKNDEKNEKKKREKEETVKVKDNREIERKVKLWDVKTIEQKVIRKIKSQDKEVIERKLKKVMYIDEKEKENWEKKKKRWKLFSDRVRRKGGDTIEIEKTVIGLIPERKKLNDPKTVDLKESDLSINSVNLDKGNSSEVFGKLDQIDDITNLMGCTDSNYDINMINSTNSTIDISNTHDPNSRINTLTPD